MSDQDKLKREITRYVDGLMSPAEQQIFLNRIEDDPELKTELAAQQQLKEVTDEMNLAQLPDEIWDGYWKGIYRQIERGAGWFLLSAGMIILLSVGAFHLFADFLLNPASPLITRLGTGVGILGVIILLVSIARERYFASRHERYEEVER